MRRVRRQWLAAGWAVALLWLSIAVHVALLVVLPGDGSSVEAVYARGIYPVIGRAVAFLPGLLPFSLTWVLIIVLVAWVPGYALLNLSRWRRRRLSLGQAGLRSLLGYSIAAAIVFHGFYLFWGYNYLRPPLEQRLGLDGADISAGWRRETARRFVETTVAARVPIGPWDRDELDRLVDQAMDKAVRDLEGRPPPVVSPLKGDLGTGLLAWQGQGGFIDPLTLEAHVDFGLPPFRLAFLAAHEKAHLAGFARERDANFVAWYALSQADDPRLRYAGYLGVVTYFLSPDTRELAMPLEPDLKSLSDYYARHVSRPLQRGSRRIYRVYLRANHVSAGLGDYAEVWQLITAWLRVHGQPTAVAGRRRQAAYEPPGFSSKRSPVSCRTEEARRSASANIQGPRSRLRVELGNRDDFAAGHRARMIGHAEHEAGALRAQRLLDRAEGAEDAGDDRARGNLVAGRHGESHEAAARAMGSARVVEHVGGCRYRRLDGCVAEHAQTTQHTEHRGRARRDAGLDDAAGPAGLECEGADAAFDERAGQRPGKGCRRIRILHEQQARGPRRVDRLASEAGLREVRGRLDQNIGHRLDPVVVQVDDEIGRGFRDHIEQTSRNSLTHGSPGIARKATVEILAVAVDESRDILETHRIDERQRVNRAGRHAGFADRAHDLMDDGRAARLIAMNAGGKPDSRAGYLAVEREHGDAPLNDIPHSGDVDQAFRVLEHAGVACFNLGLW